MAEYPAGVGARGPSGTEASVVQGSGIHVDNTDPANPIVSVNSAHQSSGALPTVQLVTATGHQVDASNDRRVVTPVTLTPTAGAAATCLVEVSPDNTTYSPLGTETVPLGTALDSFIRLIEIPLPTGWYIRLTVTHGTLGLSTYY